MDCDTLILDGWNHVSAAAPCTKDMYRSPVPICSATLLIVRLQGSLQLDGVVREGLAYVARDAHAYGDEQFDRSAIQVCQ